MCVAISCSDCGRPTWRGCGAHVDQVLAHVRPEDRCQCREAPKAPKPKAEGPSRSLWDRLRGR